MNSDLMDRYPTYDHIPRWSYSPAKVYLGTIITDLTLEQARWSWQSEFKELLLPHIHCFSPLRGYEEVGEVVKGIITANAYHDNPLTTDAAIVTQDFQDVSTSNLLVMNYLGAKGRSLGMSGEVAWAYALKIPVCIIMEDSGNPNDHSFIRRQAGFRVNNFKDAAKITNRLLTPGL